MDKDVIDVSYTEVKEEETPKNGDITINADPLSTFIHETVSGFCGIVNNVTNAFKEYRIAKQQEETRRAEIRAYLKIGLEEINAKKEILLKQLSDKHEIDMAHIRNVHEIVMKQLDSAIDATNAAIECAKQNNDFSQVIEMLKYSNEFVEARSQFTLQLMDKTGNCESIAAIGGKAPAGYLK